MKIPVYIEVDDSVEEWCSMGCPFLTYDDHCTLFDEDLDTEYEHTDEAVARSDACITCFKKEERK